MKFYYMTLLFFAIAGCNAKQKIIEQQQENLLMMAITNGQWKVTSYLKGSSDVTTEFALYKFQFKNNYTVDAIKNNNLEMSGTWVAAGDALAQTMTARFTNSVPPLSLLNGTWNIISTTWTSVIANMVVNSETYTLRLDKL